MGALLWSNLVVHSMFLELVLVFHNNSSKLLLLMEASRYKLLLPEFVTSIFMACQAVSSLVVADASELALKTVGRL